MQKNYLSNYKHNDCFDVCDIEAVKSNCNKRKVGAYLEVKVNRIVRATISGCNYHDLSPCTCVAGKQDPFVIHAEQVVLQGFKEIRYRPLNQELILYVTYEPCLKCAKTIVKKGVRTVYYRDSSRLHDGLNYLLSEKIEVIQCKN